MNQKITGRKIVKKLDSDLSFNKLLLAWKFFINKGKFGTLAQAYLSNMSSKRKLKHGIIMHKSHILLDLSNGLESADQVRESADLDGLGLQEFRPV